MDDDTENKGSTRLNIAIFAFGCLVFGGTMYGLTRESTEDKKVEQLEQTSEQAKAADTTPDKGEFAKMETNEPEGMAPPEPTPTPGTPPAADPAASGAATAPSGPSP